MFGGHLWACIIFLKILSRYSICRDYTYRWNKHQKGLVCISNYFNTLSPRQNGEHCADGIFKCIYLNGSFNFYSYFIEVCFQLSDSWYVSVDLGNGVAPTWQQDITWPNANLIHWRIHLSPSSTSQKHVLEDPFPTLKLNAITLVVKGVIE